MELFIPGYGELKLAHLVMDFNGTLAIDGKLISGVRDALDKLSRSLRLHVLTADTFGIANDQLEGVRPGQTLPELASARIDRGYIRHCKRSTRRRPLRVDHPVQSRPAKRET